MRMCVQKENSGWELLAVSRHYIDEGHETGGTRSVQDGAGSAANGGDSMATDEQLMLEFQKGSHGAFNELFLRYREPVYGFFRRRVAHPARAEELAQESFVALLRGAQRYEPRATFRAYLFGVAYKILANDRRKLSQNSEGAGPGLDFPGPSAPGGAAPGRCETGIWVREAVEKLDGNDRDVLLLREYEELSYEEIAGVLRVPVNTVRSRLFRARLALKEILAAAPGRSVRKENALESSI